MPARLIARRACGVVKTGTYKGYEYTISPREPYAGIGWTVTFGPRHHEQSSGAFYDDCEDHPEGAYMWAENSVKRRIDKLLATVAEFDRLCGR